MSELKEHQFCDCDEVFSEYPGPLPKGVRPYYLKYEADKLIAEKDAGIAGLKADIADLRDDKKSTDAILDEHNAEVAKLQTIIEERDKTIAELHSDYKEACDRLQTANLIKDEQMARVAKRNQTISSLRREIVELERRVYAANRDADMPVTRGSKMDLEDIKRGLREEEETLEAGVWRHFDQIRPAKAAPYGYLVVLPDTRSPMLAQFDEESKRFKVYCAQIGKDIQVPVKMWFRIPDVPTA